MEKKKTTASAKKKTTASATPSAKKEISSPNGLNEIKKTILR